MEFSTYNPVSASTTPIAPQAPAYKQLTDNQVLALKILGFNENGQRNTWGKTARAASPLLLGGGLIAEGAADFTANQIAKGTVAGENVNTNFNKDLGFIGGGLMAGAGLATGNIPMVAGSATTAIKSFADGGIMPGGSHASGKDLAIVDKQTGADTGTRIEGGELLFSKERTADLMHALKTNNHDLLTEIIEEQLAEGGARNGQYGGGGTMQYADGTDGSGINPYSYVMSPYFDPRSVQPNMEELTIEPEVVRNNYYNPNDLARMTQTQPVAPTTVPTTGTMPVASGGGTDWTSYIHSAAPYVLPIAQTVMGYQGVKNTANMPTFVVPDEYKRWASESISRANMGYTPEQWKAINNAITDEERLGRANIWNASGGNAGAALGNLSTLAGNSMANRIQALAGEEAVRNAHRAEAGATIATDLNLAREAFLLDRQEKERQREAAAQLLNTGVSNLQDVNSANTYMDFINSLPQEQRQKYMDYMTKYHG